MQLARLGWHPVRLDTAQMASNADLLAIRGKKRVSLQVKTTDAKKRHSHSDWLGFGYATGYLRDKSKIFNSKPSSIIADIVVAVSYAPNASEFFVLPVASLKSYAKPTRTIGLRYRRKSVMLVGN